MYLQVKLCDPCLSALRYTHYTKGAILILFLSFSLFLRAATACTTRRRCGLLTLFCEYLLLPVSNENKIIKWGEIKNLFIYFTTRRYPSHGQCPSVCPSEVADLSKRLDKPTSYDSLGTFLVPKTWWNFNGVTPTRTSNAIFDRKLVIYLKNTSSATKYLLRTVNRKS